MSSPLDTIKAVQAALGVTADGAFGPISRGALNSAIIAADSLRSVRSGLASSFADPKDIADFRECKADGGTDQQCFRAGDNGIGKWGTNTTLDRPMCALPPEDWQHLAKPDGALVIVTANGRTVTCELRDTMPKRANIRNGACIDLNPTASKALGLKPPHMVPCTWQWAN